MVQWIRIRVGCPYSGQLRDPLCLRLDSETNEDNESTGEGKQTSYPAFTRTVPNSPFRNPTPLDVPNLNSIPSLNLSPLPLWVTDTTTFRDKYTPTHSCVSTESRRAGTGEKFVVGYEPGLRMARRTEKGG